MPTSNVPGPDILDSENRIVSEVTDIINEHSENIGDAALFLSMLGQQGSKGLTAFWALLDAMVTYDAGDLKVYKVVHYRLAPEGADLDAKEAVSFRKKTAEVLNRLGLIENKKEVIVRMKNHENVLKDIRTSEYDVNINKVLYFLECIDYLSTAINRYSKLPSLIFQLTTKGSTTENIDMGLIVNVEVLEAITKVILIFSMIKDNSELTLNKLGGMPQFFRKSLSGGENSVGSRLTKLGAFTDPKNNPVPNPDEDRKSKRFIPASPLVRFINGLIGKKIRSVPISLTDAKNQVSSLIRKLSLKEVVEA